LKHRPIDKLSVQAQPLNGLVGDIGDELEVLVDMQHRGLGELGVVSCVPTSAALAAVIVG
jgi:hypothetical protein